MSAGPLSGTALSGTALTGPVRVIGTGMVGTSIGLALRRLDVDVQLVDANESAVAMAERIGAGTRVTADAPEPQVVIVSVPPDHTGAVVAEELAATTTAVVNDACSVKSKPLADTAAIAGPADLVRYVGSHPMAGSERSGPLAGRADLFDGATWAVTPHESSDPAAVQVVHLLAQACGAKPVHLSVADHDLAVARVSHLPHLMSALAAGTLLDAPDSHLELSGQGLRDVTRIAAGDPVLWTQIVSANTGALTVLLERIRGELDRVLVALGKQSDGADITEVLADGVTGAARVPGKHGGPHTEHATVIVNIPDRPGQLAKLFADAAASGANVEDLRIDHSPGRPVGHVELAVKPAAAQQLAEVLTERGWVVHR
jgi:prephenate dehydrogenase